MRCPKKTIILFESWLHYDLKWSCNPLKAIVLALNWRMDTPYSAIGIIQRQTVYLAQYAVQTPQSPQTHPCNGTIKENTRRMKKKINKCSLYLIPLKNEKEDKQMFAILDTTVWPLPFAEKKRKTSFQD
ncbi:hypothetical protein L6452_04446 [Arctium lappa]|uniref:Uncharacterized protein n=1 Tax=Arctium lappa TaxID=4217 RepID=A0ACB9ED87_ARCLA|nr:hypothetical protein L6452_04446 [Arctium lappa]